MIETYAQLEEEDSDTSVCKLRWNPAHFGDAPRRCDPNGQLTIWFDCDEPPDPDDYPTLDKYETAWQEWEIRQVLT